MKLSEAAVNSIFYDDNTKFNGNPIKWVVMGQNIDGQGITTLASYDGITDMAFDVKEPQNPDEYIQTSGNGNYEYSNILQWLNSDKAANEWYEDQHEYDQSPNSDTVGDTYANREGFLNGFTDLLKGAMSTMTKMNLARKVHFPGAVELIGNSSLVFNVDPEDTDLGVRYPNFQNPFYSNIIYKSSATQPGILVRSAEKNTVLSFWDNNTHYGYGTTYSNYSPFQKRNNKSYIVPIIYVNSNMPVRFSDNAYHSLYSVSTPYSDYGNHKGGFTFGVRVDSGESGNVTVNAYTEGFLLKTATITPNTDATITLSDNDVSGLAETAHTIRLEATQGNFSAETSFVYTKTAESTPVIMAEDIGIFAYKEYNSGIHEYPYPLTVSFQVYDEDQDNINVRIEASEPYNTHKFTVFEENNVPQNTTISYTLTEGQLERAIINNNDTKIIITASNGSFSDEGAVTTTIPFETTLIPTINPSVAIRWDIDEKNNYQDILDDVSVYDYSYLAENILWESDVIDKPKTEAFIDGYKLGYVENQLTQNNSDDLRMDVIAEEKDLPFFEKLSGGTHTITVNCYNTHGYKGTITHDFTYVGTPTIDVDSDLGEHNSEFVFSFDVTGINDTATIMAYLDEKLLYQFNYVTDGEYNIKVSDSVLRSIGGGTHEITFSLLDELGKTATASTEFSKVANKPVVFMANNLGDRTATFAVTYVIKNAYSEHPSLKAYMDSKNESNVIADIADASTTNQFTLSAAKFAELSEGSHTIITVVTNTSGSTTVNTAFNVITSGDLHSGLKLGYEDDTWDGTTYPNRIYEQNTVTHNNVEYQTFIDRTPYDTEGEAVTGGMLATISRGIQNALSANVIVNSDGSLTETSANGTTTLTKTDDGYIEVYADKDNNTITKQVFFNVDGTIAESTSYVKGE